MLNAFIYSVVFSSIVRAVAMVVIPSGKMKDFVMSFISIFLFLGVVLTITSVVESL